MRLLKTVTTASTLTVCGSFSFSPALVKAFHCSSPTSLPVSIARTKCCSIKCRRVGTTTTELPLAFFLPDEDRQIKNDDDRQMQKDDGPKEESDDGVISTPPPTKKKDNQSMAFLKKMGRVGGAANKNFVNAVGSDEGSTGRQPPAARGTSSLRKSRGAFVDCAASGVVDDLSAPFPGTSSGSSWRGVTDRAAVPGGASNGQLRREVDLNGRAANVLAGRVVRPGGGADDGADGDDGGAATEGFLQMVTDLPLDPSRDAVDVSDYDGIEIDVLHRTGTTDAPAPADGTENVFHLHVRGPGTLREASYRHAFALEQADTWETVRVPFSKFRQPSSDGALALDPTAVKRIGVVAKGRDRDVFLAVGGLRFYSVF